MNTRKYLILLLAVIIICGFLFRNQLFSSAEIVQLFPLPGTEYLQLETRGKKSWLRKLDWETGKTTWKTAVAEAAYDTNSYSSGWLAPYTVTTDKVFVYRFLRNYPIPHRKSQASSFQWAVDLETGELLWHSNYPVEGFNFNFYLGSLQVDDNVLVNFTNNENDINSLYIHFVDMNTGKIVGDEELTLDMTAIGFPEVIGSNLLLQDMESFYIIDTKKGDLVHTDKQYGYGYSSEDRFYYISRDSKIISYSLSDSKMSVLGNQKYNPFWNTALYEGDIISITNNGEHESGHGSEIYRVNPETGNILWKTVISDEYNVNGMNMTAKALPHADSWCYPLGPYAPLILKKRVDDDKDFNKIAVVDLSNGNISQKSQSRQLSDTSLLMYEMVQIDDLIYINTEDDWTLLVFDPVKGHFLTALTIVYAEEEKESIVFPGSSLQEHWGIYPISNGKVYIGWGDWKCVVDLKTAELVYSSTPNIKVINKTEDFFDKYGL